MKRPIFYISVLVAIIVLVILSLYHLIGYRTDNAHKIPTITMELVEPRDFDDILSLPVQVPGASKELDMDQAIIWAFKSVEMIKWRLVADPPPAKDLVVIIGKHNRPISWEGWHHLDFIRSVTDRDNPPFYVVIGKSNRYSPTYKGFTFGDWLPIYVNPLPSVSVVGKGIHIDAETLAQTLPARTYGGHIIPKGHKFVPYRIGNLYGIDKEGNLLKRKTRIPEK